MLKVVAPTIDNVPRHALLLRNLSAEQRLGLYKDLCNKAGKEVGPGMSAFSNMNAGEQASTLVGLLTDYDNAMSGYIVVGVSLPVRTTKEATNEKRWNAFAEKVESTLNEVVRAGYQGASITRFEDYGVLVVGFKTPPSALVGSIIPTQLVGGPMSSPGESDPGQELKQQQLVARLVMQGKARVRASMSQEEKKEEIRKIAKEVTCQSSAEDIRCAIEILDKHVEMHVAHGGCTGKDCELVDYCTILRETLIEQRNMQLC